MTIPNDIADRIATAARPLATAASTHLGTDCIWHALACQHLLAREGVNDVRLVAGYAAWRVDGQDPGAVVCHHRAGAAVAVGAGGFLFHTWVSCGSQVFDATTYQFRQKLAELDAADGGRTRVSWCPDYLLADRKDCKPLRTVRDGMRASPFCYDAIPAITEQVAGHPDTRMHRGDIVLLEHVYERIKGNGTLVVMGPRGITATA
jgi:hypothetical protein